MNRVIFVLMLFFTTSFCYAAPSFFGIPMDQSYDSFIQAVQNKGYQCDKYNGGYIFNANWQNEECYVIAWRSQINPQWVGSVNITFRPHASINCRYKEFADALTEKYGIPTSYEKLNSLKEEETVWTSSDVVIELVNGIDSYGNVYISVRYYLRSINALKPQGIDNSNL